MTLADFTQGRDNNFHLIRAVAALAVLVTHSFALTFGSVEAEPLYTTYGVTLGTFAVDIFFIVSGLLVAASLMLRQNLIEFFWARFLRIYPALWVMLLLTVFGLGLWFTRFSTWDYLTDRMTWSYLLKCGTLILGVAYQLPGVFEHNAFRLGVNGSLWSMPREIQMYVGLVVLWVCCGWAGARRLRLFQVFALVVLCVSGAHMIRQVFTEVHGSQLARLTFMFFSGVNFYLHRERVRLSGRLFAVLAVALLLSLWHREAFLLVYSLSLGYLVLYLAYVPAGFVRHFNGLSDYSYGTYIYAFPVQQSIAALAPGVGVWTMLGLSAVVTVCLAVMSWHWIEKPALDKKRPLVAWTERQWTVLSRRWVRRGFP